MSIHIHNGIKTLNENSRIQYVPFHIHADSDAEISKRFNVYVKTEDDGTLTGSFRGYPLNGKEIVLPEGYKGMVLHERIKPITDKDERKLFVLNTFSKVVYWNWDKKPSKNDKFIQALDWIDIAEALHSPIVEE